MSCSRVYQSQTRKRSVLTWALPQHNGSFAKVVTVAVAGRAAVRRTRHSARKRAPALLSSPSETVLRIELPGLRSGRDPAALDVSGPGVRVLSSDRSGSLGDESRWRVRVRIETAPGPLPLVLVARYADGRSVTIRQTVTVIPARTTDTSGTPFLTIVAAIVGLLAVATVLLLVGRSRTRR